MQRDLDLGEPLRFAVHQVPEFELDFSAVRRNDFSTHAKKGKVALGLMAAGDMASAGAHMSPAVGLFRSLSGVSPS